jgi:hypothetical protein
MVYQDSFYFTTLNPPNFYNAQVRRAEAIPAALSHTNCASARRASRALLVHLIYC